MLARVELFYTCVVGALREKEIDGGKPRPAGVRAVVAHTLQDHPICSIPLPRISGAYQPPLSPPTLVTAFTVIISNAAVILLQMPSRLYNPYRIPAPESTVQVIPPERPSLTLHKMHARSNHRRCAKRSVVNVVQTTVQPPFRRLFRSSCRHFSAKTVNTALPPRDQYNRCTHRS